MGRIHFYYLTAFASRFPLRPRNPVRNPMPNVQQQFVDCGVRHARNDPDDVPANEFQHRKSDDETGKDGGQHRRQNEIVGGGDSETETGSEKRERPLRRFGQTCSVAAKFSWMHPELKTAARVEKTIWRSESSISLRTFRRIVRSALSRATKPEWYRNYESRNFPTKNVVRLMELHERHTESKLR